MSPVKSTKSFAPVDRESLADIVYRRLRESILSGDVRMGEQIVETRLALEMSISRAPIREAFKRLTDEGLLVEKPRHGTFVREFDAGDFIDIYNLRLAIETAAVRLFVRSGSPTDELEKLLGEIATAASRGDAAKVAQAELRFHETMCRLSGNEHLASAYSRLGAQILLALTLDDEAYSDLVDVATEHEPLLAALARRDEPSAVREIQHHIVDSVEAVLERLGGSRDQLLTPLIIEETPDR